ncbi:MAG: LysR family transcriptional regulator [Filomicrobium sp.]
MDRLRAMEVFVAVADAGSFVKAGERMRISPPAVTRAVSALEERLGARLLNRTTRRLNLTEAGQRYVQNCRHLLADFEEAERDAIGQSAMPQGHLTLTASMTFGRMALSPIVGDFLTAHPKITASLMLVDRVVNFIEEGIDVAVRIGDLPDSSLVARRVGEVRRVMVASPDYLAKRGAPEHPTELKLHSVIGFTGLMANREWRFVEGDKAGQVSLRPRLEINDAAAAINAAQSGEGITTVLFATWWVRGSDQANSCWFLSVIGRRQPRSRSSFRTGGCWRPRSARSLITRHRVCGRRCAPTRRWSKPLQRSCG